MHRIVALLGALIISLALMIEGAPVAKAEPDEPTAAAAAASYRVSWLTTKQYWRIKRAATTVHANGQRTRLNYRIARDKFGSHIRQRREFAAGWIENGTIYNISKRERRKIRAVRERAGLTSAITPMAAPNCTGETKHIYRKNWRQYKSHWYWNSCRTNKIKGDLDKCRYMIGIVGSLIGLLTLKPVAVVTALLGTSCDWTKSSISSHQSNSSVNAIIVQVAHIEKVQSGVHSDYARYVTYRFRPQ